LLYEIRKEAFALSQIFVFCLVAFGALVSIYFWIQVARIFLVNHALNEETPAKSLGGRGRT